MLRVLLGLVLVVGCGRSSRAVSKDAPPVPIDATLAATCLVTLSVGKSGSVLEEQRAVGPHAFDFFATYPAATIDRAAQAPVELTKAYQIDGAPLLWFTADKAGVVVDAAALSELTVADATRMRAGESVRVGQLTAAARGKLPGRELVTFLIQARAIATYVHIGAELCLAEEREASGTYTARFTGEHTYFTNEKNVEPLAFEVVIDADGVITARRP